MFHRIKPAERKRDIHVTGYDFALFIDDVLRPPVPCFHERPLYDEGRSSGHIIEKLGKPGHHPGYPGPVRNTAFDPLGSAAIPPGNRPRFLKIQDPQPDIFSLRWGEPWLD